MSQFRKVHRILAFLAFLISFATYYLTSYPSISFGESGSLAAAAFHQQVPPGPGAPLWIIVAGTFAKLLPGDPAYVLTLFSSLCAAATAMLVYLIAVSLGNLLSSSISEEGEEKRGEEIGRAVFPLSGAEKPSGRNRREGIGPKGIFSLAGGMIAALSFAWFDSQWSNATQITTRSAGTLIVALVLWLGLEWYHSDREGEEGSLRRLLLAAFVAGLALGVDHVALGVIPGIVMLVWIRRFLPEGEEGRYVLGALLAMVGILLLTFGVAARGFLLSVIVALVAAVGGTLLARTREAALACAFLVLFVALGYSLYTQVALRTEAHPALNMMERTGEDSGILSYINALPLPRQPGAMEQERTPGRSPNESLHRQVGHFYTRYLFWNTVGRASDVKDAPAAWFALPDETEARYVIPADRDNLFPIHFFALPLLLALVGMFINFRTDWRSGVVLLTLFLSLGPLSGLIWKIGPSLWGTGSEGDGFFASSLLIVALWIGLGGAGLARIVREGRLKQGNDAPGREQGENLGNGMLVLCFILVPLNLLYHGWGAHNRYDDRLPHDFAWNLLQSCDSNAILFAADASPLRYLQDVEDVRRDVRVVDLRLAGKEWYRRQLQTESVWNAAPVPTGNDEERAAGSMRERNAGEGGFAAYTSDSVEMIRLPLPAGRDTAKKASSADSLFWRWQGVEDDKGRMDYDVSLRLIRGIVEENRWRRPVYFAMNVNPTLWGGLQEFFRWEGLAFQVVPEKGLTGVEGYTEFPVDSVKMGRLLSERFLLDNLNERPQAFTETERKIVPLYRRAFIALAADALKNRNRPEECVRVLEEMDRRISIEAFPLAYWDAAGIAVLYGEAGERKGAERYARHAAAQIERAGGTWRNDPIARRYNPYQTAARMYAMLGDYDKAINTYQRASRAWSADPVIRGLVEELRVERHLAKGDTAAAAAELRGIISAYGSPTDQGMRNNLEAWKEMLQEME